AMSAIDDDAHPFQCEISREGTFGVFDVTTERVVHTNGFADMLGGGTNHFDVAAENEIFDFAFDGVVEFVTIGAEKFNAVVIVGIVRGGDDNAGVGAQAAGDISDPGSGKGPDEDDVDAHGQDTG